MGQGEINQRKFNQLKEKLAGVAHGEANDNLGDTLSAVFDINLKPQNVRD